MPVLDFKCTNNYLNDRQDQVERASDDEDHARKRVVAVSIEVKAGILKCKEPDNRRKNERPEYLNDEVR